MGTKKTRTYRSSTWHFNIDPEMLVFSTWKATMVLKAIAISRRCYSHSYANDGNWYMKISIVEGPCARYPLLRTLIWACKIAVKSFTAIKHANNESVDFIKIMVLMLTSMGEMVQVIGIENRISCSRLRYSWDYLTFHLSKAVYFLIDGGRVIPDFLCCWVLVQQSRGFVISRSR